MIADLYAKGEHPLSKRQPPRDLGGRERHQNCRDHYSNNETLGDSCSVDCSSRRVVVIWHTKTGTYVYVVHQENTEVLYYRMFIHWQSERKELVLSKAFATFVTLASCYHSQVNIKEGILIHNILIWILPCIFNCLESCLVFESVWNVEQW